MSIHLNQRAGNSAGDAPPTTRLRRRKRIAALLGAAMAMSPAMSQPLAAAPQPTVDVTLDLLSTGIDPFDAIDWNGNDSSVSNNITRSGEQALALLRVSSEDAAHPGESFSISLDNSGYAFTGLPDACDAGTVSPQEITCEMDLPEGDTRFVFLAMQASPGAPEQGTTTLSVTHDGETVTQELRTTAGYARDPEIIQAIPKFMDEFIPQTNGDYLVPFIVKQNVASGGGQLSTAGTTISGTIEFDPAEMPATGITLESCAPVAANNARYSLDAAGAAINAANSAGATCSFTVSSASTITWSITYPAAESGVFSGPDGFASTAQELVLRIPAGNIQQLDDNTANGTTIPEAFITGYSATSQVSGASAVDDPSNNDEPVTLIVLPPGNYFSQTMANDSVAGSPTDAEIAALGFGLPTPDPQAIFDHSADQEIPGYVLLAEDTFSEWNRLDLAGQEWRECHLYENETVRGIALNGWAPELTQPGAYENIRIEYIPGTTPVVWDSSASCDAPGWTTLWDSNGDSSVHTEGDFSVAENNRITPGIIAVPEGTKAWRLVVDGPGDPTMRRFGINASTYSTVEVGTPGDQVRSSLIRDFGTGTWEDFLDAGAIEGLSMNRLLIGSETSAVSKTVVGDVEASNVEPGDEVTFLLSARVGATAGTLADIFLPDLWDPTQFEFVSTSHPGNVSLSPGQAIFEFSNWDVAANNGVLQVLVTLRVLPAAPANVPLVNNVELGVTNSASSLTIGTYTTDSASVINPEGDSVVVTKAVDTTTPDRETAVSTPDADLAVWYSDGLEVVWDLDFEETFDGPLGAMRIVDVLPFAGDGVGGPADSTHHYNDVPTSGDWGWEFGSVAAPAGATVMCTAADPATISRDPKVTYPLSGDWAACAAGDPVTAVAMSWDSDPFGDSRLMNVQIAAAPAGGTVDQSLLTNTAEYDVTSTEGPALLVDNGLSLTSRSNDVTVELLSLHIGDYVWEDLNKDGVQDADEAPIEGVELILCDADGVEIARTATDANGWYEFSGLAGDSTYTVKVSDSTLPAGPITGMPWTNTWDLDDELVNPDGSATVTLGRESNEDVDFGYAPLLLGDYVWEDLNYDGVQDADEAPIEGVEVVLHDADWNVIATTTTDANGWYEFVVTADTTYIVGNTVSTVPTGLVTGNPWINTWDYDAGLGGDYLAAVAIAREDILDVDFGYAPAPAIDIEKWVFDHAKDKWFNVDDPALTGVKISDTFAKWKLVVHNTGDVALQGVQVSDDLAPECDFVVDGILEIGEQVESICETSEAVYDLTVGQVVNTASTSGFPATIDPETNPEGVETFTVTDEDPEPANVQLTPVIDVEKLVKVAGSDADAVDADTSDEALVRDGLDTDVEFSFVVSLADDAAESVEDIAVSDSVFGPVECPETVLGPGESMTCTAVVTAELAGLEQDDRWHINRATVTGTGTDTGTPVTDDDDAWVFTRVVDIEIDKYLVTADGAEFDAATAEGAYRVVTEDGSDVEAIRFEVRLTDDSNVPAADVHVDDDVFGAAVYVSGDVDGDELLDVDETWIFEVADLDRSVFAAAHVNVATVTGTPTKPESADPDAPYVPDTDAPELTDDDELHTVPFVAHITIEKSTNGVDADLAGDAVAVDAGSAVKWTYEVRLSDDSTVGVANVIVTDDREGAATYISGDTDGNTRLDVGEVWLYEIDGVASNAQGYTYANIGDVTGFPVMVYTDERLSDGEPVAVYLTDTNGDPIKVADEDPSHYRVRTTIQRLAHTGASVALPVAIAGLLLLAAGAFGLAAARSRRKDDAAVE